jgi:hypothetical protein
MAERAMDVAALFYGITTHKINRNYILYWNFLQNRFAGKFVIFL